MSFACNALEVCGVSYAPAGLRHRDPLISDISFSVAPGRCVALVGPNGAGKTTLVRLIAGLATPSVGEVKLGGKLLAQMPHAERAKQIAYVGQTDEPDGRLSVADYVTLGRVPHRRASNSQSDQDATHRAVEAVDLGHLADRRLDQLSGGERQRAKIARAICQSPSLLILDEPTNHLDPQARGEQLELVASMSIAVIAALHDLTLIDAFADDVVVLKNGRLRAVGGPAEALTTSTVRDVFGVELHRLPHPDQPYDLPTLDIPLGRSSATSSTL